MRDAASARPVNVTRYRPVPSQVTVLIAANGLVLLYW